MQVKDYQIAGAGLGFIFAFLGVMISDGSNGQELAALVAPLAAIAAMLSSHTILWMVYFGVMAFESPIFAQYAHLESTGPRAGPALILVGMWLPALVNTPPDLLERSKSAVSGVLNAVGLVLALVGFLAAILLWSEVGAEGRGAPFLGLSVSLVIGILLFLRTIWWTDLAWKRLGMFWFAYLQTGFLALAAEESAPDAARAAGALAWLAVVGFMGLIIADGFTLVSLDSDNIKSLRFILVLVCLLLGIIGASLAHKDHTPSFRWQNAVAVLAVFVLLLGTLSTPDSGRPVFQHIALGFTFSVISPLFIAARLFDDQKMKNPTAGAALMITAIFLAFLFQAENSPDDFKEAFANLLTNRCHRLGGLAVLITFIGLGCLGGWADQYGGADMVGFIGLALLNLFFFVAAFFLAPFWNFISLVTSTIVMAVFMHLVSLTSDSSLRERGLAQFGSVMVWFGHVLFIATTVRVLPKDYNDAAVSTENADDGGFGGGEEDDLQHGPRLIDPLVGDSERMGHEGGGGDGGMEGGEASSYQRYEAPSLASDEDSFASSSSSASSPPKYSDMSSEAHYEELGASQEV